MLNKSLTDTIKINFVKGSGLQGFSLSRVDCIPELSKASQYAYLNNWPETLTREINLVNVSDNLWRKVG